jgi:hypothetical protein
MPGTEGCKASCGRALIAASLLLALLAGGCASGAGTPSATPSDHAGGYSGSGSLTDLFFSGTSARSPQTVAGAQSDVGCPPVEVRQGASTLIIGPTGNKTAMSLRYQGAFTREARECAVVDGNMVMRIGVQGHVIVGPAGGPGQVDVPLRIAVVQETPGGAKPVATKFVRIPVTIGPDNGNVPFAHIEEGVSFPLPTPISYLDDYVAYVGFDPLSAQAQDQQLAKEPPRQKRRNRPATPPKQPLRPQ